MLSINASLSCVPLKLFHIHAQVKHMNKNIENVKYKRASKTLAFGKI